MRSTDTSCVVLQQTLLSTDEGQLQYLKTVVFILVCHINLMLSEYEEDNVKVKFINQGQYLTVKVKVVKRHSVACSLQEFQK